MEGAVEAVLEDRDDRAVGRGADRQPTLAGGLEPHDAIGPGEAQDAETGSEALLGMRLGAHDRFHQCRGSWPDLDGKAHHLGRGPAGIAAVRARHVVGHGGVVALRRRARMGRDPLALMEQLDGGLGEACVEHLADQPACQLR
jgi:hypothetical protein